MDSTNACGVPATRAEKIPSKFQFGSKISTAIYLFMVFITLAKQSVFWYELSLFQPKPQIKMLLLVAFLVAV